MGCNGRGIVNPLPSRKGERNLYCPYYDDCLSLAIKGNWLGFSCTECSQKNTVSDEPEDMVGVIALLAAIFYPEVYRRYRREAVLAAQRLERERSLKHIDWFGDNGKTT